MASEWLLAIWPQLISACHLGVVGIDPSSGIGSAINIAGPKHDFCESRESGTHACGFRANDVFHWIARRSGNESPARIGFDRGGEKAERQGRLSRGGEHF